MRVFRAVISALPKSKINYGFLNDGAIVINARDTCSADKDDGVTNNPDGLPNVVEFGGDSDDDASVLTSREEDDDMDEASFDDGDDDDASAYSIDGSVESDDVDSTYSTDGSEDTEDTDDTAVSSKRETWEEGKSRAMLLNIFAKACVDLGAHVLIANGGGWGVHCSFWTNLDKQCYALIHRSGTHFSNVVTRRKNRYWVTVEHQIRRVSYYIWEMSEAFRKMFDLLGIKYEKTIYQALAADENMSYVVHFDDPSAFALSRGKGRCPSKALGVAKRRYRQQVKEEFDRRWNKRFVSS